MPLMMLMQAGRGRRFMRSKGMGGGLCVSMTNTSNRDQDARRLDLDVEI